MEWISPISAVVSVIAACATIVVSTINGRNIVEERRSRLEREKRERLLEALPPDLERLLSLFVAADTQSINQTAKAATFDHVLVDQASWVNNPYLPDKRISVDLQSLYDLEDNGYLNFGTSKTHDGGTFALTGKARAYSA